MFICLNSGWVYYCGFCSAKEYPTSSTWFAKNNIPFKNNILLIYSWVADFTVKQAVRELSISKPVVIDYYYFIRSDY